MEEQVISRAHRMGASRPIHVETLAMRGTIEEQMLHFLQVSLYKMHYGSLWMPCLLMLSFSCMSLKYFSFTTTFVCLAFICNFLFIIVVIIIHVSIC